MVFSSNAFLFLFLPLFLAVYYLTPNRNRYRNYVILAGSYAFYGWWRLDFLALFIALTAFNYWVGREIGKCGPRTTGSTRWVQFGVIINLAVLGYFKYSNFGIETFNGLLGDLGFEPVQLAKVILPIGISFYTFESISYIVDVHRGSVKATRHPVDFATFVALFPHLIVGPIFRYRDLAQQFEQREHSLELFGQGSVRFMQGFVKKVVIADTLAPLSNTLFALHDPSTADAWLASLCYGAQLYYDFSGYSDMAVGLGLMMGFRFVENFNHPFLAQSTTEFWRRWHISLSNWLRDYVFYSMGSGRKTKLKIQWMVFITFLTGGIWHGANWTFITWGFAQGLIMAAERGMGVTGIPTEFKWRRWIASFSFSFGLGMILFRSESLSHAWLMYQPLLFTKHVAWLTDPVTSVITGLEVVTLLIAYSLIVLEGLREFGPKLSLGSERQRALASLFLLAPLFLLAITKLSAQGYSAFLYFQF